ncbi:hypothetical protein VTL71DRAFT_5403 [Oculimacula yallundae]|uniref:Uncharacterized protein n=1 Tax=Oculimacula yallundae TaxID=86028 RepID=A0ABR4C0Z1_9HELO
MEISGNPSSASGPGPEGHGDVPPRIDSLTIDDMNETKEIRLKQILKTFQAQLDLQQKQLDLIKGLAEDEEGHGQLEILSKEVPKEGTQGEEAETFAVLGYNNDDIDRALVWQEKQSPISPDILTDSTDFLASFRGGGLYYESSSAGQKKRDMLRKCEQLWPISLGEMDNMNFYWAKNDIYRMRTFKYEAFGKMSSESLPSTGQYETMRIVEACLERPVPFGKLLSVAPNPGLALESIAIICLHLHTADWGKQCDFRGHRYHAYLPRDMLISFLLPWPKGSGKALHCCKHSKSLFLEMLTIRYFTRISELPPSEETLDHIESEDAEKGWDGIPVAKERGEIFNFGDHKHLHEARIGLFLMSEYGVTHPCFNIVQLTPVGFELFGDLDDHNRYCGQFAAMHVFVHCLVLILGYACQEWGLVMDGLDENIGATITDLLNAKISDDLMFDNKKFSRSKLYFTTQQLCRIFKKSIEDTIADIEMYQRKFISQWDERRRQIEMEDDLSALNAYWTKMMIEPKLKLEAVLQRIKNKQEEIESLRDGLFNATSVREASRGTEIAESSVLQNQYLFVFTIMTVVYLPLGFVTSIFGMHLFDTTDSGVVAARPQFYITLVVLSLSTYIAAGLAFWFVRNKNKIPPGEGLKQSSKKGEQDVFPDDGNDPEDEKSESRIFAQLRKRKGSGKEKQGEASTSVDAV